MATGKTTFTMICPFAGAITNIILDPIMIYGLLGCPVMGVRGLHAANLIWISLPVAKIGACAAAVLLTKKDLLR